MRASQTGASALLGFLSALQQGGEQRNAQREQFLQQKMQQADQDRAFALQQGSFDLQKAEAERARRKEDLNAPVEALTRKQALGAPDVAAQQGWNAASDKASELKVNATALRLKASTTRNPIEAQTLRSQADMMEQRAGVILQGEQNLISVTPGVTIKPWESAGVATGMGVPATGMGAPATGVGAQVTGVGAPATGMGSPATGMGSPATGMGAPATGMGAPATGTQQVQPPTQSNLGPFGFLLQGQQTGPKNLPLTSAEMELFDKVAKNANLGSLLGVDYFQRPDIGYEPGKAGPAGQYYGRKSFIRSPKSYDPDYQRFIGDKAQSFVEMFNEIGYVADQNYIPKEQAFESILGRDKSLWPVQQDANGQWVAKQNWWSGLTSDQKTRFTSRVSKYIAPSETLLASAKDMRESVTKSLETVLAEDKAERERRWKLYDDAYERETRKAVASISNVNNKDPQAAAVLQAAVTDKGNAYTAAKDSIETFRKIGNSGTGSKEMAANLMGVDATTLDGIDLKTVTDMYAAAERLAINKLNSVNALRNPDLNTQLLQQTSRYGMVAENALREAAQAQINKLRNTKTNNAAADTQRNMTIEWIKNRAGIVETVK